MFGQYVAHDITADRSPVGPQARPARSSTSAPRAPTSRASTASGQIGSPYLFRADDPDLLLLGTNDRGEPDDLPRNSQGIALIGDPRNDVHLFVSQLQVAMIRVHNRLVERARSDGVRRGDVFATARRETAWHYQWVILNDYLPRLVGPALAEEARDRGRASTTRAPTQDPLRVRRRRLPLRPRPGARRVPRQHGLGRAAPVPGPARLPAGPGRAGDRLAPALRRRGRAAGTAREAIDGTPGPLADRAARRGDRRGRARRLPLARRPRPRSAATPTALPSGEAVAAAMGEDPLGPDENALAGRAGPAGRRCGSTSCSSRRHAATASASARSAGESSPRC